MKDRERTAYVIFQISNIYLFIDTTSITVRLPKEKEKRKKKLHPRKIQVLTEWLKIL